MIREPNAAKLRASAAIRVGVAVLVAGAITAAAIAATWGPLDVSTDIVGYPIFYDNNGENWYTAYYLVIGFFPIASLLLFWGLTRVGPRIGLPVPAPRGGLRPARPVPPPAPPLEAEPPLDSAPATKRRAVGAARIAFVGAILGYEAGVATDSIWLCLGLGVALYALAVAAAAAVAKRWLLDWTHEARLAAANAAGLPLAVAGLIAISLSTEVLIAADGSVDEYPWLPVWLGIPAAAALIAAVVFALRRAGSAAAAFPIERRALVLVAAPVAMFVLIAWIPGDVGPIDTFHSGELLVGERLVGEGWLPWRDVVLTHGVLPDVVNPGLGLWLLQDSYWGSVAGYNLLAFPLYFVSSYLLFAYLFGRNWLFLLFAALLPVCTQLAPTNFRFILWPLALLLLATVLRRPTPLRSASLGVLLVAQTLLTPETAPTLLSIAVVVVAFELYSREPGAEWRASFPRTLWLGVAGFASAAAFAGFMAGQGALDDFVELSRTLTSGHSLTGAHPPSDRQGSGTLLLFEALAPVGALLAAFAYAATRLRLRIRFSTADWVMAAVALAALPYYAKFLARMDLGHVAQVYSVTLPLILYVVYRLIELGEQIIADRGLGRLTALTAHPLSLLGVVLVVVLGWSRLTYPIENAPTRYQPVAQTQPEIERLGYAEIDPVLVHDMKRILDAYLDPDDRVFDFVNSPALFHYLIERDPSTRYFHATLAIREQTQDDLIERLEDERPKLIVFDSTYPGGLVAWDGISTTVRSYDVSRWILDNYRPLLTSHGHTFYARRDQPPPDEVGLRLAETPLTEDLQFQSLQCDWGYAPDFLSADQPEPGAEAVSTRLRRPSEQTIRIVGWAGDAREEQPARRVVAVHGSRIVAEERPDILRPELGATGVEGFTRAGYEFSIPLDRLRSTPGEDGVRVLAFAADGSVAELGKQGAATGARTVRIDGRRVRLDPKAIYGSVDRIRRAPVLEIAVPPGTRWSDYDWLEVKPRRELQRGRFYLYDQQTVVDGRREITFQASGRSQERYLVPVASCPQWRGYRGRKLLLSLSHHQGIAAVRLLR